MLAFALTWKPRLRGMSARRRSMTFSCLSAATSAGMVPRIAVRTACCRFLVDVDLRGVSYIYIYRVRGVVSHTEPLP